MNDSVFDKIANSGPVFWNALPQKLREPITIKQYKRNLNELLLMGYET